jgi:hypothetical protein
MSVVFTLGNNDDCAIVDGHSAGGTTANAGTAITGSVKTVELDQKPECMKVIPYTRYLRVGMK